MGGRRGARAVLFHALIFCLTAGLRPLGKEGGLSEASSYKPSSTAEQAAAQGGTAHRATRPFWEEQGEWEGWGRMKAPRSCLTG